MLRRARDYARSNAVAFLALFVALGGTGAYAANTIGSADVIDNSLLSQDLKDGDIKAADIGTGQVLGSRIADGTVKSIDVDNNSLSGWDINESSLGKVPAATTADQAATVRDSEAWRIFGTDGEPALGSAWSRTNTLDATTPGYYVDREDVVHLRGTLDGVDDYSLIVAVPHPICRPAEHEKHLVAAGDPGASQTAFIELWQAPDLGGAGYKNDLVVSHAGGSTEAVRLDGLSYRTCPLG